MYILTVSHTSRGKSLIARAEVAKILSRKKQKRKKYVETRKTYVRKIELFCTYTKDLWTRIVIIIFSCCTRQNQGYVSSSSLNTLGDTETG